MTCQHKNTKINKSPYIEQDQTTIYMYDKECIDCGAISAGVFEESIAQVSPLKSLDEWDEEVSMQLY